ncbi:MAG: GNAT family N-acetyltransferase [Candidatus Sericytochromatia bacterium]
MSEMAFYTPENLHHLEWPAHADGRYARSLLVPFLKHGPRAFIDNVEAEMQVMRCGDLVFPLVLARAGVDNAYVCSPTAHYVDYARRELEIEMGEQPLLKGALDTLIQGLGAAFRPLAFERVVYVNNWLLSTNLYPAFDPARLELIRDALRARFPDRALIFRSVNLARDQAIYDQLRALDFQAVFSRQVYLLDPATGAHRRKNPYKEDRRLARKAPYVWDTGASVRPTEIPRLRALYDDLYLHKYSRLNPQFNTLFLRRSLSEGWLHYAVLRRREGPEAGRIDAMLGYVERNGVFTTPLVGYDRSLPLSTGLYRLVTLYLFDEAERRGWVLNHSSGASRFKTLRGCVPSMEYNLVYTDHLPLAQQLPWRTLARLSGSLIEPLMRRFAL